MTRAAAIRALVGAAAVAVGVVPGVACASVLGKLAFRLYAKKSPILRDGGMIGSAVAMSAYMELSIGTDGRRPVTGLAIIPGA
jgi:hypothetical protein